MKDFINFIDWIGFIGEGGGPTIIMSNRSIAEDASVGDLIGILSVTGGSGTYAFTMTSSGGGLAELDAGDDTRVEVADALDYETTPSFDIGISADNGVDPAITRTFSINVTDVIDEYVPSLDFSDARNSQYLGQVV